MSNHDETETEGHDCEKEEPQELDPILIEHLNVIRLPHNEFIFFDQPKHPVIPPDEEEDIPI